MADQLLKHMEKISPFMKCLVAYSVWMGAREIDHGSFIAVLLTAMLKCAPVFVLGLLVRRHPPTKYNRRIMYGLFLSAAGDVCLVWPSLFLPGMAVFGLAHIAYCSAFGWLPLGLEIALPLFSGAVAYNAAVIEPPAELMIPVIVYTVLVTCTSWRAFVKAVVEDSTGAWTGAIGASFFLLSDAILGFGMFGSGLPCATFLVMTTYYFAQMSIALSAVVEKAY